MPIRSCNKRSVELCYSSWIDCLTSLDIKMHAVTCRFHSTPVYIMKNHCISALDRPLDPYISISCFATLLATQDVMVCRHLIYSFSPQVIFEATVSEERQGYIALDDIVLLNYPCCKYPFRCAHSLPADLFWAWGKCPAEQWKSVQFQGAQRIPGGDWKVWGETATRATETPMPCLRVTAVITQQEACPLPWQNGWPLPPLVGVLTARRF